MILLGLTFQLDCHWVLRKNLTTCLNFVSSSTLALFPYLQYENHHWVPLDWHSQTPREISRLKLKSKGCLHISKCLLGSLRLPTIRPHKLIKCQASLLWDGKINNSGGSLDALTQIKSSDGLYVKSQEILDIIVLPMCAWFINWEWGDGINCLVPAAL